MFYELLDFEYKIQSLDFCYDFLRDKTVKKSTNRPKSQEANAVSMKSVDDALANIKNTKIELEALWTKIN